MSIAYHAGRKIASDGISYETNKLCNVGEPIDGECVPVMLTREGEYQDSWNRVPITPNVTFANCRNDSHANSPECGPADFCTINVQLYCDPWEFKDSMGSGISGSSIKSLSDCQQSCWNNGHCQWIYYKPTDSKGLSEGQCLFITDVESFMFPNEQCASSFSGSSVTETCGLDPELYAFNFEAQDYFLQRKSCPTTSDWLNCDSWWKDVDFCHAYSDETTCVGERWERCAWDNFCHEGGKCVRTADACTEPTTTTTTTTTAEETSEAIALTDMEESTTKKACCCTKLRQEVVELEEQLNALKRELGIN